MIMIVGGGFEIKNDPKSLSKLVVFHPVGLLLRHGDGQGRARFQEPRF